MPAHIQYTLAIAVMSCLISISGCDSKQERKAKYLQQGKDFASEKNLDKAKVSFKNVLQIDPNDVGALGEFGKLANVQKDYQAAFGYFSKVVELEPNNFDANVEIAKLYGMSGDIAKATAYIETAEKSQPDSIAPLIVRASLAARSGDTTAAIALARQALEKAPESEDAAAILAAVYLKAGDAAAVEPVLTSALSFHPDSAALLSLLASLYQLKNEPDNVWETLRKLTALEPDNFDRWASVIKYLVNTKSIDKAQALLDEYIQAHPDHSESKLAKVELAQITDQNDLAKTLLQEYIQKWPDEYDYPLALATLTLKLGDNAKAIELLKGVELNAEGKPEAIKAKNSLARLSAQDKDFAAADAKISEVLKINANDLDALQLRGGLALQRGDFRLAIGDFRAVLKDKPAVSELYQSLAMAYLRSEQPDLAIDTLRNAVRNFPDKVEIKINLGQLLRSTKDLNGAIAQYQAAYKINPKDETLAQSLVDLLLTQEQWSEVRNIAQTFIATEQNVALGHYFLGLNALGQKQYPAAITEFDAVLEKKPQNNEALTARVNTMLATKQAAQARTWLKSRLEKFPDNVAMLNLAGELAMESGDYPEAHEYFKKAIGLEPKWPIPYSRDATTLMRMTNNDAAIAVLQQGIGAMPQELTLINELSALYEKLGRTDDAIQNHQQAYERTGRPAVIANNLAMLLITYRQDEASKKQALELVRSLETSSNPMFIDTAGWVYFKLGQIEKSRSLLENASSKADVPVVNYHLGMLYHADKNAVKARQYLTKATATEATYPGKNEATLALASLAND